MNDQTLPAEVAAAAVAPEPTLQTNAANSQDPSALNLENAEPSAVAPDQTILLANAADVADRTAQFDPLDAGATGGRTAAGGLREPTLDLQSGLVIHETNLAPRGNRTAAVEQTVAFDPNAAPSREGSSQPLTAMSIEAPRAVPPRQGAGLPAVPGYELLSELGRGGMGVVYKAKQQGLNRFVALKMILAADRASAKDLVRFSIEAEAVAQLVHPNITQIYEIGERAGCPFFSLEFVAGGTLSERTATRAQPPRRAARIVRTLAQAMDFAHRRGIIHRDLKPANVLLALPEHVALPKRGEPFPLDVCMPKITDFGLAKRLEGDGGQTRDGAILGTPNYMAPEQAKGHTKDIGPAADIYALGSILYDLLTGAPPFQGSTIMETLQLVMNREPVPPRKVNALVPSDLSTICLKCLEKDPAKRYATAGDLAEDLRRYLDGEPIQARPSSRLERSVKWVKRRPASAALIGVSVFAVLAMTVGGIAFAIYEEKVAEHADQLRIDAERQRQRAEENFLDACAAVDEMLARVGSQRLAHEPRMEQVRRELLQKAHRFYEKFLNQSGDDPVVRWQGARSSWQLGDIERMLGDRAKAEQRYQEAVQRFDQLIASAPPNDRYRVDLANVHNNYGVLLSELRRLDQAEGEHRAAQALRKELVDSTRRYRPYEQLLATSSANLGEVEYRRGQFAKARQDLTGALEEMRRVTAADDEKGRRAIAGILNNLGLTMQQLGDAAAASEAFAGAIAELRQLARDAAHKADPEVRQELAATLNNLGHLYRDSNPAVAEQTFRAALALSEDLAADFPATPQYRQEMAGNVNNLAVLLQAQGDAPAAEQFYQRAFDVKKRLADDMPWAPDYRIELAGALNNRGLQLLTEGRSQEADMVYTEAATLVRALVAKYPKTPAYELELGKCLVNQAAAKLTLNKPTDAEMLANEGLEKLRQLAADYATVPEFRFELGRAQGNLGALHELQGKSGRAEEEYRAAIETLEPLAAAHADVPDYAHQLALTRKNLGDLLSRLNRGAEAYPLWQKARDLLEPLANRYRGVPVYRKDLGHCYGEYTRRLVVDGKLAEADAEWNVARALQAELVEQFPLIPEYRLDLAKTWANLALVAVMRKENGVALERYRQSVTVLEEHKGRDADSRAFRGALLTNAAFLADFLNASRLADNKDLFEAQQRVVDLCRKLTDGDGATLHDRAKLAAEQQKFGTWLLDANRTGDARPLLEDAVANQRQVVEKLPDEPKPQEALLTAFEVLLTAYQRLDDYTALARVSEEHLQWCGEAALPRAQTAARLAECLAAIDRDAKLTGVERVALRMVYADAAMYYLQDAARRGFKEAAALKNTAAFAPLRQRADYRELLRKMEDRE